MSRSPESPPPPPGSETVRALFVGLTAEEVASLRRALGHRHAPEWPILRPEDALREVSSCAGGDLDALYLGPSLPPALVAALLRQVRAGRSGAAVVVETPKETQLLPLLEHTIDLRSLHVLAQPVSRRTRVRTLKAALRDVGLRRIWRRTHHEETPPRADRDHACLDRLLAGLRPHWQPIRDREGEVFGLEALARVPSEPAWTPARLFRLAARIERTRELERTIRRRVAAAARDLPAHLHLFVNVHPTSLRDPYLVSGREPLCELPQRVILELTGQAPLEAIADAGAVLAQLRSLGYGIGLDDLGEHGGEVSAMLMSRPDFVRLDGWLVRSAEHDESASRVLSALSKLVAQLGTGLIGEGIETPAQLRMVRGLGVSLFQGYLLGHPAEEACLEAAALPGIEVPAPGSADHL